MAGSGEAERALPRGCERYPVPRLGPRTWTNAFTATMLLHDPLYHLSNPCTASSTRLAATFDVIHNLWKAAVRTVGLSRRVCFIGEKPRLIEPRWKTDDGFGTAGKNPSDTMRTRPTFLWILRNVGTWPRRAHD